MIDRSTKALLAIIALSTTTLALRSVLDGFPVARAQSQPVRPKCVWTYIVDVAKPSIGADGKVDLHRENWKKVSDEGFRLVASDNLYLFEGWE